MYVTNGSPMITYLNTYMLAFIVESAAEIKENVEFISKCELASIDAANVQYFMHFLKSTR